MVESIGQTGHFRPLPKLDTDWDSLGRWLSTKVPRVQLTRVYHSSTTDITSSASWTTLDWDTAEVDQGGWHDGTASPDRITVPAIGVYWVGAAVFWNNADVDGYREMFLRQNASTIAHSFDDGLGSGVVGPIRPISTIVSASKGDYFQVQVRQNSGSTITLPAGTPATSGNWFAVCRLG